MTRLEGARSEQVATVTPSPPSVVSVIKQSTVTASAQPASDAKAANRQVETQGSAPSASEIEKAAKQIESYLKSVGRQLEFHIDESTGRTVITVKDSNTGEVVRQIPGEETLRLARALGTTAPSLVDVQV